MLFYNTLECPNRLRPVPPRKSLGRTKLHLIRFHRTMHATELVGSPNAPADWVASSAAVAAVEQPLAGGGRWGGAAASHQNVAMSPGLAHHPPPLSPPSSADRPTSAAVGSCRRTKDPSTLARHAVGGAYRPHATNDQSGAGYRNNSLYMDMR